MIVKPSKESSYKKIHLTINKNKIVKALITDRKLSIQQQPPPPTTRACVPQQLEVSSDIR